MNESATSVGSQRLPGKYKVMSNLKQVHIVSAVEALSSPRLSNYRRFFGTACDRAAYGLYCWNDAISGELARILALAEIALRNQLHFALSRRFGAGTGTSADWYNHLALDPKSMEAVRKVTHHMIRASQTLQNVPRTPVPSPDDVISKLTFGFWPHLLDVRSTVSGAALQWSEILTEAFPGHRHSSLNFWDKQRNRDSLYARIDYCKDLRNRIAHLEPVWKSGPLFEERRARPNRPPRRVKGPPATPTEAIARLQLSYDRALELLSWLSPGLREVYLAGESPHRFSMLNRLESLDAYQRHAGHRREAPINLNAHRTLRQLKNELRRIGRQHGIVEVTHAGKAIAWWHPIN